MKYHRVCIISGINGEHCEISMCGKGVWNPNFIEFKIRILEDSFIG
jgi:hypothetical protein